jgi:prevent-host-death family protein
MSTEGVDMERKLDVTQVRKDLARIIDEVQFKGENYIIVRHGQPAAAVVSMAAYRRLAKERQALFDAIRHLQSANPDADSDAVLQDALEAQQAVRPSPCTE